MTDNNKLPQSEFPVDSEELAKKRTGYYDQWRQLTKEEVDRVKEEEEALKKESAEKLGLASDAPKSEAERKDREKRAALKEAKKMWDGKKAQEEDMKFVLSKQVGVERTLEAKDVLHRPVLLIAGCKDCKFTLGDNLGTLIKVFVDDCENTTIVVKCQLITQHLEVSHSEKIDLVIAIPTHTVQVDLCNGVSVTYNQNCLHEEHKLYHSAVKNLLVHHYTDSSVSHDYSQLEDDDDDKSVPAEEKQYVTHLKGSRLVTERVRRAHGIMPLTDEELSKVAGTDEIEGARTRQAETKKTGGNEAFKLGEYLQAAVFYTEAMQLAPSNQTLLCLCLSNRAQCNLKLGRLEEALDDVNACIAINDKNVKGWFRKGIALHALKQYGPAIEALSRADALEPKNKQILEAIGFAKVLLAKKIKQEQEEMR